jgi:hypothetical protein
MQRLLSTEEQSSERLRLNLSESLELMGKGLSMA